VREGMTTELWVAMTLRDRCEWNRPAYDAIGQGVEIEFLDDDGGRWKTTSSICLSWPHRPKVNLRGSDGT